MYFIKEPLKKTRPKNNKKTCNQIVGLSSNSLNILCVFFWGERLVFSFRTGQHSWLCLRLPVHSWNKKNQRNLGAQNGLGQQGQQSKKKMKVKQTLTTSFGCLKVKDMFLRTHSMLSTCDAYFQLKGTSGSPVGDYIPLQFAPKKTINVSLLMVGARWGTNV